MEWRGLIAFKYWNQLQTQVDSYFQEFLDCSNKKVRQLSLQLLIMGKWNMVALDDDICTHFFDLGFSTITNTFVFWQSGYVITSVLKSFWLGTCLPVSFSDWCDFISYLSFNMIGNWYGNHALWPNSKKQR